MRLSLRWNRLTSDSLQPDIFRGPFNVHLYEPLQMAELALDGNRITTLDRNLFEHIPMLSRLSLSSNPLILNDTGTVTALQSLQVLQSLDLSSANLTELPFGFLNTTKTLTHLNLSNNRFKTLSSVVLNKYLQSLWLTGNPLEVLDNSSFKGLLELQRLFADNMTTLVRIEPGVFETLVNLRHLNCSGNVKLKRFYLSGLKATQKLSVVRIYTVICLLIVCINKYVLKLVRFVEMRFKWID